MILAQFIKLSGFCLLFTLLSGCCSQREVATKIEYQDRYIHRFDTDSIYIYKQDSIIVQSKNDTILIEKWKMRYKDRLVERTDTCFMEVEKVNTVVKEKKSSAFEQFLTFSGWAFWIVLLTVMVYWWMRK